MHILNKALLASFCISAFSYAENAEPIVFKLTNKMGSKLIALQISSNTRSWDDFQLTGVPENLSAQFKWTPTPHSNCIQYIRGKFKNIGWVEPTKINFCEDNNIEVKFSQ